ncbi:hypothetical protein RND71_043361 [Anisodus tanguticus]|uniref:Kinesin-like protein n=1 Tax=Anisodus tanguticus TaxID=243964 RepID=A0AAE1QR22_9SOLA|nr:hypothetical protein RND71_043361 [Anisodus tanguticus]
MTEKEISNEYKQIVELDTEKGVVEIHPANLNNQLNNLKSSVLNGRSTNNVGSNNTNEIIKQFTFDAVFDCNSNQSDIYDQIMRPIVDSVLEGFNGTIFAYGQTGTGKTYTMEGISNDKERRGIIPNSFSHIFNHIARTQNKQYLVRASYLEIYQEEIRDLLIKDQNKRLELKERADTGVYIKDLSSFVCKSVKEIEHVMYIGNQNRSVGSTNMNERSSRSHAIFMITIEHSDIIPNTKNKLKKNDVENTRNTSFSKNKSTNLNETFETISNTSIDENNETTEEILIKENESLDNLNSNSNSDIDNYSFKKTDLPVSGHIRVGKLNLVDLAGSERQIKTGTVGQRQKEAIKINLSLSALGNVISSLVDSKSTHIPYRDSKLTRLLQDSLGGNSKTVMIANIGPANYNYEETLTTLRYASRAKNIKNKPHVNEDPKDALLRQFQLEIERLKMLLSQRKKSAVSKNRSSSASINDANIELKNLDMKNLSEKIKQMESKLLCGGRNIIDHTNEQQRELEKKAQLIALQKQKEREIRQKLEEQQENTYEIKETFTSLQQEVELKKRELKKLFLKIQSVKSEIKDTEEANSRERRGLEEYQNESMKELNTTRTINLCFCTSVSIGSVHVTKAPSGPVINVRTKAGAFDESNIFSPLCDQVKTNGGSPVITVQTSLARMPSSKLRGKLNSSKTDMILTEAIIEHILLINKFDRRQNSLCLLSQKKFRKDGKNVCLQMAGKKKDSIVQKKKLS